jgi:hypothetical protein
MPETLDAKALIEKHRAKGVLVDTNLLVLLLVGAVNKQRIPRFKRTAGNFTGLLLAGGSFLLLSGQPGFSSAGALGAARAGGPRMKLRWRERCVSSAHCYIYKCVKSVYY